jgi:hypothetical protein
MRLPTAILLACAALSIPAIATADIAPDPLSGGVNFSGSTNAVAMSEESVTLSVSPSRCTTKAIFWMKNLTDAPVTMQVGFPYSYPDDLQDFQVRVEGKEVEKVADDSLGKRRMWKVWTMTFPASKVTKVEVEYWNELEATYSWVTGIDSVPGLLLGVTPFKTKPKGEATAADERQYQTLAAKLQHREVGYILRTGAGWAGNIGKCRIEVKFDGLTSDNLITRYPLENPEYLPRDPQVARTGLVWVLEDFEPKDDIRFQISPQITQQEVKQQIAAALKEHPHHVKLTLLWGEYCSTSDEQQQHQQQVDEMLAAWSKKMAIDGPDYVDREHADQSFRVWFFVRRLPNSEKDEALSDARLKKLLPTIKAIALRMQSQLPPEGQARTERLNEYQVKTFRAETVRVLAWVQEQSGASGQ